jgi:hypothetical protein
LCEKRLITPSLLDAAPHDDGRLDLNRTALVEVTSEEKEHPVEAALVSGEMRGWRADSPGTQTIRLIFDAPQRLTRIALVFEETDTERTQEFVLRWSALISGNCAAGVEFQPPSDNTRERGISG